MQAMVSGVSGMGYDFGAPSSHGGFASRDVRRVSFNLGSLNYFLDLI